MTKIMCCVPWASPFIWAKTMPAFLNLKIPAGVEIRWEFVNGWCSARRKTGGVELAQAWGADYIVFVDADELIEPDTLERLFAHALAGRCPVGGLQPARGYIPHLMERPYQAVCWDDNGKPFTPDKLQTVRYGPMGCCLIQMQVFKEMRRPWFDEKFDPNTMARLSSLDQRFTERLWKNGTPMWIDPTIQAKHMDAMPIDFTFQNRFDDLMVPEVKEANV